MEILDVLIIGAGPIGLNCALEAEENGLSYVIIEKGTIVNSLYNYPLYISHGRKIFLPTFLFFLL